MVISEEIKFPRIRSMDSYRAGRRVEAVDGGQPVVRIGAFKREWNRRRGGAAQQPRRPGLLSSDEAEEVRQLVERVNANLDDHHILLHLVLVQTEEGVSVEVYDCTSSDACTVMRDFEIAVGDLPLLLRNLEEESGLLVDTVF